MVRKMPFQFPFVRALLGDPGPLQSLVYDVGSEVGSGVGSDFETGTTSSLKPRSRLEEYLKILSIFQPEEVEMNPRRGTRSAREAGWALATGGCDPRKKIR